MRDARTSVERRSLQNRTEASRIFTADLQVCRFRIAIGQSSAPCKDGDPTPGQGVGFEPRADEDLADTIAAEIWPEHHRGAEVFGGTGPDHRTTSGKHPKRSCRC